MNIEKEARAEADKRGFLKGYNSRVYFIKGYLAGASRPVTDQDVEAAHRGWIEAQLNRAISDQEFESFQSRVEMKWMRGALEAVRSQ